MDSETKAIAPIDSVRNTLMNMANDFKMALPEHVTPEKFIRTMLTSIRLNQDLLKCDRQSLYAAAMRAAQDGLLPDGREGAIVAYGKSAQWSPMVFGIAKKARNSGEIASLDAQVVYENDEYDSWIDEKGQHFEHRKNRGERGNPLLTYAYAIGKDGTLFFEEINEQQMSDIEACAKQKYIWQGPFRDEMKRKSAIRRLAKYRLPSSTDLDNVIRADDDFEIERDAAVIPEPAKTSSRLAAVIKAKTEQPVGEQVQEFVRDMGQQIEAVIDQPIDPNAKISGLSEQLNASESNPI